MASSVCAKGVDHAKLLGTRDHLADAP